MKRILIDLTDKAINEIDLWLISTYGNIEILVGPSIEREKIKNRCRWICEVHFLDAPLYLDDENNLRLLKDEILRSSGCDMLLTYEQFLDYLYPMDYKKKRLALFTPLPNEKTGVACYSEELLEELGKIYKITVVVESVDNVRADLKEKYEIKEPEYFEKNHKLFDRILYQMGGSKYHIYMYDFIKRYPGVTVFHDFYMSEIWYAGDERYNRIFKDELYRSHGYKAMIDLKEKGIDEVIKKYPANMALIENSLDSLTHSNEPARIFNSLYDTQISFNEIPSIRKPCDFERGLSKKERLTFATFGHVNHTKRTLEIIQAFKEANIDNSVLEIVGGFTNDGYETKLKSYVSENNLKDRVVFRGYVDKSEYEQSLKDADVAVQLRGDSRGETSGTILDCFNYSLPTIINNYGSNIDIDDNDAIKISENFSIDELSNAMKDTATEITKGKVGNFSGHFMVEKVNNPKYAAIKNYIKIEKVYKNEILTDNILENISVTKENRIGLARALNRLRTSKYCIPKLFVDITAIARDDIKTGIQRVVRGQLDALIRITNHMIVEPVYFDKETGRFRYAREYMKKSYGFTDWDIKDDLIDARYGDVYYALDYSPDDVKIIKNSGAYEELKLIGVKLCFAVYDHIPAKYPHFFPKGLSEAHVEWEKTIGEIGDKLIAISKDVANDLMLFYHKNKIDLKNPISVMKMGHDIKNSQPMISTGGLGNNLKLKLGKAPVFLMVGTVEPRKGHDCVLNAFDELWAKGEKLNLVIVGKIGWQVDEIRERISKHPELGKQLHYLDFVSDTALDEIYRVSDCLIAASRAEGFGLPLIEASEYGVEIIARDIPIFREVCDDNAVYFERDEILADVIREWLKDYGLGRTPNSKLIVRNTWSDSGKDLLKIIDNI